MTKYQLLLFDANVVIDLHKWRIWSQVIEKCHVTLTETVVKDEAIFWEEDDEVAQHKIELEKDIRESRISCKKVRLDTVQKLRTQFCGEYFDKLDPGELESLAFMLNSKKEWWICSGDKIVYKVLGRLHKGHRGISLEELLSEIGLERADIEWRYTKSFRDQYTKMGQKDSITGLGMNP